MNYEVVEIFENLSLFLMIGGKYLKYKYLLLRTIFGCSGLKTHGLILWRSVISFYLIFKCCKPQPFLSDFPCLKEADSRNYSDFEHKTPVEPIWNLLIFLLWFMDIFQLVVRCEYCPGARACYGLSWLCLSHLLPWQVGQAVTLRIKQIWQIV